jgi:hypothetical protein
MTPASFGAVGDAPGADGGGATGAIASSQEIRPGAFAAVEGGGGGA